MNDRHPSAGPAQSVPAPDALYGHGSYAAYEQPYAQQGYAEYGDHASGHWDTSTTNQWGTSGHTQTWDFSGYDLGHDGTGQTGQYAAQQWDTSGGSGQWDLTGTAAAAAHPSPHPTGQWDTGAWSAAGSAAGSYDTGQHHSGQWDQWDTTGQNTTGQNQYFTQPAQSPAQSWDTSGQWDSGQWDLSAQATQTWDASALATPEAGHTPTVMVDVSGIPGLSEAAGVGGGVGGGGGGVADAETRAMVIPPPEETEGIGNAGGTGDDAPAPVPSRARSRSEVPQQSRGSRRKGAPARAGYRPRRKALLTVAVPSVAVMGVAGIAAASVMTGGGQKDTQQTTAASAPDNSVKLSAANSKLDTQLAGLSQGADDFASRASRTQERIDLKVRQEEDRKRQAEEAARKERERPKFALPVSQHGLSAYYGQAGVNWMSVHTGIDFPVGYGTPVMAATDGTVSTQYNVAYGNMAKVTSSDGTETWYCHLSSYKLRSGPVKAGDVIAYSGNSGNSTGPHLHFEVHPGGSAIDPLPWLRSHDLDPT
ncbi:M23 family metallopeptidase [Streptomyces abikoensis]|uniref:M23 family metallopeptidase n=1 Tax=Streptomyces abikoensis TaxID=97398 RepID=UPI0036A58CC3